jgi:putative ABC transport system permease protein
MLRNYLTTVLRILRRQRGYALITVGGLALAMAVCVLTITWAQYEFSFDKFHKNGREIYRFVAEERREQLYRYPGAPVPLAPALAQSLPEVRRAVRLTIRWKERVESPKTVSFENRICQAEPSLLEMFDFPLIQGDPRTALADVDSAVLSESAARQLFGTADPVGQTIYLLDKKVPTKITGVMRDVPKTSHLQFDIVVPLKSIDVWYSEYKDLNIWDDWRYANYPLYVQLSPGADLKTVEGKAAAIVKDRNPKATYKLWLQPLFDAHLGSRDFNAMGLSNIKPLGLGQVRLFLIVSFVVLLMAAINYTNLATARSLKRIKEIGIRKVNGARRTDVARQFLGESVVLAFLALAGGLVLIALLFPLFKTMTGRELDLALIPKLPLALSLLGLTVVTGLASGVYPAFFASSFAPVRALKDDVRPSRGSFVNLRRGLVAVQIVGSATLIVVTAVFLLQMHFIKTKDLGFDPKNILDVPFPDSDHLGAFKNDLLRNPRILAVADGLPPTLGAQGHRLDGSQISWEGKPADLRVPMDFIFTDEDYVKTYRMNMAQGRFFSKEFPSDKNAFVLNESAVRAMNVGNPIGLTFTMGRRKGPIVGVIKDFHLGTLRAKIGPAVFLYSSFNSLAIRIDPKNTPETIRWVETTWKSYIKEIPFESEFLEDKIGRMYEADRNAARLVSLFGLLSLIISSLGLFGLTSFMAEQKTKEIGIRKVLGATVPAIVRFMSREFAILVGTAIVLAIPLSFYVSSRWIETYAYRIGLAWWIFAGSGIAVAAVTLLTIGWRSVRAAVINPVETLRYE